MPSSSILLLDDDPRDLALEQQAARPLGNLYSTGNPREAIERAKRLDTAPAVAVADVQMHGGTGIEFLAAVHAARPEAGVIALLSADKDPPDYEQLTACGIDAFLTKPCRAQALQEQIKRCFGRIQEREKERELLQWIFDGALQVLTNPVPSSHPEASRAAETMSERACALARALKLPSERELRLCSHILRIGTAAVPAHVRGKIQLGERLTNEEQELIDRIPEMGARMLAHLPKLAPVAMNIHSPLVLTKPREAPLGACILRAVVDLQVMEDSGLETRAAFIRLTQRAVRYHPGVIKELAYLFGAVDTLDLPTTECMVEDLHPGMVLAADALNHAGVTLITRGTTLSPQHVDRLNSFAEMGDLTQPLLVALQTTSQSSE
ncbi:response regulator [Congregicoccus parvus]|uniref:response regulator n=1 Tax=Congregicoccus parvus TaxID=3081749 RepID=UPI003FA5FDC6